MEKWNANDLNAIAVIVGVMAVVLILNLGWIKDYFRGRKMRQARREEIQYAFIERIVDFTEEDVACGNLTREEATREVYEPLKRIFNSNRELYPSPEPLKERIEKRIKAGVHEPVELPDVQKVVKPRHMFDKG